VEKVVGSGDTLADGSDVDPRRGCIRGKWELGDGVEGGRALPSAVKFTLQIELDLADEERLRLVTPRLSFSTLSNGRVSY